MTNKRKVNIIFIHLVFLRILKGEITVYSVSTERGYLKVKRFEINYINKKKFQEFITFT